MKCFYILFTIFFLSWADSEPTGQIKNSNNKFTPAIYKQISKSETGNIIVSPLSASLVLTLLEFGCKGPTAQQLLKGLFLPNSECKIKNGVKSLLSELQENKSHTFTLANKIYVQENFTIRRNFQEIAVDYFGAASENIDFTQSDKAAQTINQWVENKTDNTIKNLLSPQVLKSGVVVILVNALHFKANWSSPFLDSLTQKGNFYKSNDVLIQVDYLYQNRKHFNYYESIELGAEFLELPFVGGNSSMIFVLPKERNGLNSLENQSRKIFNTSIPLKSTYLNIQIPKFKFDYTIDFQTVLENLNVTDIFDPRQADLSGIAGKKGDLVVSKVVQKAFIDLNAGGVEASAATYIGVSPTAVIIDPPPKNFVIDHPFIFMIKEKGVIIFAGRVNEPKY